MPDDNQRTAAGMKVTLSGSMIAGAFAVLGVVVAITTFTILNKESLGWFYAWASLAALSLVISMVTGGKGISKVFKAGYEDKWPEKEGKGFFDTQALFGILGLTFAVVSVFTGQIKSPTEPDWAKALERRVENVEQRIATLEKREAELKVAEPGARSPKGLKKKARP